MEWLSLACRSNCGAHVARFLSLSLALSLARALARRSSFSSRVEHEQSGDKVFDMSYSWRRVVVGGASRTQQRVQVHKSASHQPYSCAGEIRETGCRWAKGSHEIGSRRRSRMRLSRSSSLLETASSDVSTLASSFEGLCGGLCPAMFASQPSTNSGQQD